MKEDGSHAVGMPVILDIGHSIDDFFAIALSACSPEIDLLGVVTAQDRSGSRALLARTLLDAYGRTDVPVARGEGTGIQDAFIVRAIDALRQNAVPLRSTPKSEAVEFMQRSLAQHDAVRLAVVGPLTNIAHLLGRHPEAARNIAAVYFMGGWTSQALPEHNCALDPDAADHVIKSGVPITAFGYEVTRGYSLLQNHHRRLESAIAPGPRILHILYRAWCDQYRVSAPGVLDPMVISFLCGRLPLQTETMRVSVQTAAGPARGAMYRDDANGNEVHIVTEVDASHYIEFIMSRIVTEPVPKADETNPSQWDVTLRAVYNLSHYAGWSLTKVRHASHTVALIREGKCDATVDGEKVHLEAGSALYVPPRSTLSVYTEAPMRAVWLYFDVNPRGQSAPSEPLDRMPWPYRLAPGSDRELLISLGERIERYWMRPWPEAILLRQAALLELIAHLQKRAHDQEVRGLDSSREALLMAKRWIEAHVTESITLDQLAEQTALSKYHLVRLFRETFGVPPMKYHCRLRMEYARRLLTLQHLSIREVAGRLGYTSQTAFPRAYRRELGISPSEDISDVLQSPSV